MNSTIHRLTRLAHEAVTSNVDAHMKWDGDAHPLMHAAGDQYTPASNGLKRAPHRKRICGLCRADIPPSNAARVQSAARQRVQNHHHHASIYSQTPLLWQQFRGPYDACMELRRRASASARQGAASAAGFRASAARASISETHMIEQIHSTTVRATFLMICSLRSTAVSNKPIWVSPPNMAGVCVHF